MSTATTSGVDLPVFTAVAEAYVPVKPMTGETAEVALIEPSPNPVDFVSQQRPKSRPKSSRKQEDPDQYLLKAKALVVQNYNEHRDPRRSPQLNMDLVYITTFTKTLNSWKALIGSTVVRGLMWEVTYNGNLDEDGEPMNEAYIDIFKRINHVRIPLGD